MPEAFIEQVRDVFVVERVIGDLALLPESHEPHLPERSQTVRDGRLRKDAKPSHSPLSPLRLVFEADEQESPPIAQRAFSYET
jgi:hypothetical protein